MIEFVIKPFLAASCAHERILISHAGTLRKNSDPSQRQENLFVLKKMRFNEPKGQLIITRDVLTTLFQEYARSARIVDYFCKKSMPCNCMVSSQGFDGFKLTL